MRRRIDEDARGEDPENNLDNIEAGGRKDDGS
jgi:hypothetical protein